MNADGGVRDTWLDRTVAVGGSVVRLAAHWRDIAPSRPSDGTDPADPAYHWGALDGAVQAAAARHLRILVTVSFAPDWAEGPGRPKSAPAGTWRPSPAAFGRFMSAAARRYSGTYRGLPRVRFWQPWNETNLTTYLTPQWTRRHGRFQIASAPHYRRMLNAAYSAVKGVDSSNYVVAAGTAPYGDPGRGGRRIQPVAFVRDLLCLKGGALKPRRCPSVAHFDAFDHHPYSVGGPLRRALNADDVGVPDLGKLTRVLNAAVRHRRVSPVRHKPLWVTEISWDSSPPDPDGVPLKRHAAWLAESFYLLWKQGVRTVTWFQIRDSAPTPSYAATYQSGVFFADGRAKPAATAFRFPFVAWRSGRRLHYWGRPPTPGEVTIEQRRGSRWASVARARGGVFGGRISGGGSGKLRARTADATSGAVRAVGTDLARR